MLKYKLKNKSNKWKMLLSKVAELDSSDSATMDNIVEPAAQLAMGSGK